MPENHGSLRIAGPKAGAAKRRRPENKAPGPDLDECTSAYVERVLAGAPPLTQEQRDAVAALLRGGAR